MYSKRPTFVVGFHGCDQATRDAIVMGHSDMTPSKNNYDWLGEGYYFWENSYDRALEWAQQKAKTGKIKTPAVLGAYMDLGRCLDLLDACHLQGVQKAYASLEGIFRIIGSPMPQNQTPKLLKRPLDRLVIDFHAKQQADLQQPFDSVRGVFWEGNELYPSAGMLDKNHIQICVRNLNCIKAFFIPRDLR